MYLRNVESIQVELSNVCNAQCIGCRRTGESREKKFIELKNYLHYTDKTFLDETIFESIVSSEHDIKEIEFCGTIDEPLAHPKFLHILQYLLEHKPSLTIQIHTNGALRDNQYYYSLSQILQKFNDHNVRFSIDGLKESHYLYRGLNAYDKILSHAKTFIQAGGNAFWQMLLFPWNEDEVKRCEHIANTMNFERFIVRHDKSSLSKWLPEEILEARKTNYYKKPLSENILKVDKQFEELEFLTSEIYDINCLFQSHSQVFLNWKGQVWPCCFLSGKTEVDVVNKDYNVELYAKLYRRNGENFNSIYHFTFDYNCYPEYSCPKYS